jgi:hypothetical protein
MGSEKTPREDIKYTRDKTIPSLRKALLFRNS